jgi:hypothetical protein
MGMHTTFGGQASDELPCEIARGAVGERLLE